MWLNFRDRLRLDSGEAALRHRNTGGTLAERERVGAAEEPKYSNCSGDGEYGDTVVYKYARNCGGNA